jgi:hypothetical protein
VTKVLDEPLFQDRITDLRPIIGPRTNLGRPKHLPGATLPQRG